MAQPSSSSSSSSQEAPAAPSRGHGRLGVVLGHLGVGGSTDSGAASAGTAAAGAAASAGSAAVSAVAVAGEKESPSSEAVPLDLEGAKFGAINALRTGNPVKDMATAMMVPMVFKAVFDGAGLVGPAVNKILDYFKQPPEMSFTRSIKVEQTRNSWGYTFSNEDSRNTVLVKAINLYLSEKPLKLDKADVSLESIKENRNCWGDSDNEGDGDDEDKDSRSEAGQLKKNYRLVRSVPEEKWTPVGDDGIMYMKCKEDNSEGDKDSKCKTTTVTVSLMGKTEAAVDGWIEKVYNWYLDELRKMQDHSRYMYELAALGGAKKEGEESSGQEVRKYRRYKLSDEKTFQSLFFPEKETLLKILSDFQTKAGKYSIPGYPHKLGLLLHGPPGTGKTSMIKAMAHHTQRNIVNVPLARIQTNAELMDVMFDSRYHIMGQEVPIKLRFKDVIFVMEDVDAISKIVHRRDGKEGDEAKPATTTVEVTTTSGDGRTTLKKTMSTALASVDEEKPAGAEEGKDEEGKDKEKDKDKGKGGDSAAKKDSDKKEKGAADDGKDGKSGEKKSEAPKDESKATAATSGVDDASADQGNAAAGILSALFGGPTTGKDTSSGYSSYSAIADKLNLSGLLNALDGVVDSPNRILIMTTNHPEKLDPALIRPGRVDKKFLLGYMAGKQCSMMVSHYFQTTLGAGDETRICQLVDGQDGKAALDITPARLEQLCAEHDAVDGLCDALAELAGIPLRPRRLKRLGSVNAEAAMASSEGIAMPGGLGMPGLRRVVSEPDPSTSVPAKRW